MEASIGNILKSFHVMTEYFGLVLVRLESRSIHVSIFKNPLLPYICAFKTYPRILVGKNACHVISFMFFYAIVVEVEDLDILGFF